MIFIASDHAGFELKNQIIKHLQSRGEQIEDCGSYAYDPNDDYPDFVSACAQKVAATPGSHGVAIGGSGQGEAIVANKIKGIRAVLYYGGNLEIIKLSRRHNDANVLSLGARFVSILEAQQAVDLWLATAFEGGRHERRIDKIKNIEK